MRSAVISLAKREAREAVKRKLRAEGHRPHSRTLSEINRLANAYLKAHTAELLAQAEASRIVRVDPKAKFLNETPVRNGAQQ